jgi:hypothetical protein
MDTIKHSYPTKKTKHHTSISAKVERDSLDGQGPNDRASVAKGVAKNRM